MAKNIQVNLQFNANVKNARTQLQELQNQLNSLISNTTAGNFGITPKIQEATRSAMDLKIALNNAVNVNTGKLNLNKFQAELARSGKSIQQIARDMKMLGPEGVKSFNQAASAIAQADTKLLSLQGGLKKVANTFMNTLRWQVASQAIMAVTNSISQTIDFAKELDTSLNKIQIVTNKSSESMAQFAKQANQAAKNLGTTTTKYTDASLIYYQQGLNDKAVKERTDVTVKMANVVGKSAQEVSNWMTSIWNNFDNGSKSLEYYGDIVAKLGATTAASAEEIATGMQKFAAVADTIGLSYEYAASALATIVAETRQSEEIVGTSLKTILSRMEQLKQGDTLDDGTTLGQYSLALEKVGVKIKDATGGLKDMDEILKQTGNRWSTLSRDQQVALSQQVAGIRQYSQFMALMDNWDVMEKNLETTKKANGALAEQQRIYENSAKAAEERFKASTDALKMAVIGGDDVKSTYDILSKITKMVTSLVESFGGLKTIVLGVVAALTKVYSPQMTNFLAQSTMAFKHNGQQFKADTLKAATQIGTENASPGAVTLLNAESEARQKILKASQSMNENEKQRIEWELQLLELQKQQALALEDQAKESEKIAEESVKRIDSMYGENSDTSNKLIAKSEASGRAKAHLGMAKNIAQQATGLNLDEQGQQELVTRLKEQIAQVKEEFKNLADEEIIAKNPIEGLETSIEEFSDNGCENIQDLIKQIEAYEKVLKDASSQRIDNQMKENMEQKQQGVDKAKSTIEGMQGLSDISTNTTMKSGDRLAGIQSNLSKIDTSNFSKEAQGMIEGWKKQADELAKLPKRSKAYKEGLAKLNKEIEVQTQVVRKDIKDLGKKEKALSGGYKKAKAAAKSEAELTKEVNKEKIATEEATTKVEEHAEKLEAASAAAQNTGENYEELGNKAESGGFQHWSDTLTSGISTVTTLAMSLTMMTSSVENLSEKLASGNASWQDWISSIASAGMALGMYIPTIFKLIGAINTSIKVKRLSNILTDLGASKDKAAAAAALLNAGNEEAASEIIGTANVTEALARNSKNASSPVTWPAFVAGLAAIAIPAAMLGISAIGGASKGAAEKRDNQIEKDTNANEAIKENKELSKSVSDLTKEYKSLRNSGESTAEVLKKMKEQIPDLISKYKELAKTLNTKIDTSNLEDAYKVFLATGDTTLLEQTQKEIDDQLQKQQNKAQKRIIKNSKANISDFAKSHIVSGNDKGGWGETYNQDIEDFDEMSGGEIIDAYYKRLEEGEKFAESTTGYMQKIIETEQEQYDILLEDALKHENDFNKQVFGDIQESIDQIKSEIKYEKYRQDLIDQLKKEKGITEEHAKDYLSKSSTFGGYEQAASFFSDEGLANFSPGASKDTIDKIKEWFAALPEEERTLAMNIDYTVVGNEQDAEKALEKVREQMQIAKAKDAALNAGADEKTFDAYVDILKTTNKFLAENEVAANQVASANYTVNKGLSELNKTWDSSIAKIRNNTRGSYEYAEGIAEIGKALRTMFGVELDANFIERHLTDLGEILNGNFAKYEELQNEMAKEFVENLNIEEKKIFSLDQSEVIAQSAEDIKNAFKQAFDDISNLQLGEGMTLSGDYLNTLQQALDAGQITKDQLEKAFKLKGYDLTLKTHKVPGPTTTYTRHSTGGPLGDYTETIEEKAETEVPLIGDSKVTVEGKVGTTTPQITATKTSDKSSLNINDTKAAKSSNKTELKKLDDELDRYHQIKATLTSIENTLNKLSTAKSRAFGADKLALIKKENKALDEQLKTQKELTKAMQKDLLGDGQKIAKKYGAKFDKNGNISNYEQIYRQEVDYYNKMAHKKDLGHLTDDEWKKAQDRFKDFKDDISQYESTLSGLSESVEKEAEIARQKLDNKLEAIDYTVTVKINIEDRKLKTLQRLLDRMNDPRYDGAKKVSNYTEQANSYLRQMEINKNGIKQVLESAGATKSQIEEYMKGNGNAVAGLEFTEEQIENLEKYTDALGDNLQGLIDIEDNIKNIGIETFEAWHQEIEDNAKVFAHATSMVESYKNIIDIVGKKKLGVSDDVLKTLEQVQMNAANASLANARAQKEATERALKQIQENLAEESKKSTTSENYKRLQEQEKTLKEQLMEDEEEFMSAWTNSLQTAADIFQAQMDRAFEKLEDELAGAFSSFEELNDYWNKQQQVSERYLDNGKKTYELSKLNRKIQQDLDKTNNVKAQKELLKLQKEIADYAKDGVRMSQRDVDYLQKRYDLKVAEIALQEAQSNKSIVRLQKDSEGNFGYVYTADENKIAAAEQNVEDKLEALREYGIKANQELTSALIQNEQEMIEALKKIRQEDYENVEEYNKAVQRITEFYQEKGNYLRNEMSKNIANSQKVYKNDYLAYQQWNQEKLNNTDNLNIQLQDKANILGENASGWLITTNALTENLFGLSSQSAVGLNADQMYNLLDNKNLNLYNNVATWVDNQINPKAGEMLGESVSQSLGLNVDILSAKLNGEEGFFNQVSEAANLLSTNLLIALGNAGASKTLSDFGKNAKEVLVGSNGKGGVSKDITTAEGKIKDLGDTSTEQFSMAEFAVNKWYNSFDPKIQNATTDVNSLDQAIESLESVKVKIETEVPDTNNIDKLKNSINELIESIKTLAKEGYNISTTGTIVKEVPDQRSTSVSGTISIKNDSKPKYQTFSLPNGLTNTVDNYLAQLFNYNGAKIDTYDKNGNPLKLEKGWSISGDAKMEVDAVSKDLIQGMRLYQVKGIQQSVGEVPKSVTFYINQSDLNRILGEKDLTTQQYKKYNLKTFSTGGYTGAWGPDGRLAMLHQKELVLNAHDTENFLTAIDIVRDISDQIEKNALSMQAQNLFNYNNQVNGNKETLQQEVTIHAEFPNATNHSEIEEAFRNLTNYAAQYVNRKS